MEREDGVKNGWVSPESVCGFLISYGFVLGQKKGLRYGPWFPPSSVLCLQISLLRRLAATAFNKAIFMGIRSHRPGASLLHRDKAIQTNASASNGILDQTLVRILSVSHVQSAPTHLIVIQSRAQVCMLVRRNDVQLKASVSVTISNSEC